MSRTVPYVNVECDKCGYKEEELELSEVSTMEGEVWSEQGVNKVLEGWGWDLSGDLVGVNEICSDCVKELEEENEDQEEDKEGED